MHPKDLTATNAIGTIWKYNEKDICMLTGPISDCHFHIMNFATGLLHYYRRDWSLDEIIDDLEDHEAQYIGHLSELDIDSFVEEKECLEKI